MKLQLATPSQGVLWIRQGLRTYVRQPLALTGLFFLFLASMSVLTLVPFLGNVLALALLPGATLGLMVATEEAAKGKFPLPLVLLSAFRASSQQLRAMLQLGALYAIAFLLVMLASALVDGGKFAHMYLLGAALSPEDVQNGSFVWAGLLSMLLYLPVSLAFWHAPALVHWHGVTPLKSLFFSLVACWRNFGAFCVYGLLWVALALIGSLVVAVVTTAIGGADALAAILYPVAIVLASMFFPSIYFSFRGCFSEPPAEVDSNAPNSGAD